MQAQLRRRPGVCIFCAFTRRLSPHAPSLHTSAALWRDGGHKKRKPDPNLLRKVAPSKHPPIRDVRHQVIQTVSARQRRLETDLANRETAQFSDIRQIAFARFPEVKRWALQHAMLKTMNVKPKDAAERWRRFEQQVKLAFPFGRQLEDLEIKDDEMAALGTGLVRAYKDRGVRGTDQQLENAFLGQLASTVSFSKDDFQNQRILADLRYPTEWYPSTRKFQRKIIMHVGPTNSGKTYHALKRLATAKSGAYAGPLRLLAHEVYTRMNAQGVKCSLVTGEERRLPKVENDEKGIMACTVEMIPLREEMDVVVIDEIQMIGDMDRGWAWTQAVLGCQAKELHLCGEARTVPLIRELAATMGDQVEVHKYERLTPLAVDSASVSMEKFRDLRKGDCIVAFSVSEIYALRKQIQEQTGQKVAIVYGSLPPETRAAQAKLFNDPNSGYDVLVASDAIGMGLNLTIKRVIFASVIKFNGYEEVPLTIPHLKQIAGRAGRYKSAHEANQEAEKKLKDGSIDKIPETTQADVAPKENMDTFRFADPPEGGGLVSALSKAAMPFIKSAMETEPEPLKTAGLFPPDNIIERFANYFPPGTPFSYILLRLLDICRVNKRFHMCLLKDQLAIADAIQQIEGLTVLDRILFVSSPASVKWEEDKQLVRNLAKCAAEQKNGNLLDIKGFNWSILDRPVAAQRRHLRELESLHKAIVLYLWLSYRFSGVFSTRALAFHAKAMVEEKIEATLEELTRHGMLWKQQKADESREFRLAEYRQELMDALEADEDRPVDKEERAISGGSRYEETDILDGADEGEDVEPVGVEDETVDAVEEGAQMEDNAERAETVGEEDDGDAVDEADEAEDDGLADSFGNMDAVDQGLHDTDTNTAGKPTA